MQSHPFDLAVDHSVAETGAPHLLPRDHAVLVAHEPRQ
jgi:hypothetical protein